MNLYLDKLQPPSPKKTLLNNYLSNPRLVILIVASIVLFGISSFLNLPRRLNPEVNIPFVSVTTILPGANPQDIETLVTIPLEEALSSVENTISISSISKENLSTISVEFTSTTDPSQAKINVQSAIDTVVTDLPTDALSPRVNAFDIEDQPVWTFSLSGELDPISQINLSQEIHKDLKNNSFISRVDLEGIIQEEIVILINSQKAAELNFNPLQLNSIITNSLRAYPAGNIQTTQNHISLTIDPVVTSIDQLRQLPINLNDQVVNLSDIGAVRIMTKDKPHSSFINSGEKTEPAIIFSVYKTKSANITQAVSQAKLIVEQAIKPYNQQVVITSVDDNGQSIQDQFDDLSRSFAITILLVFITLFIFLGIRQAIIVSISIPLTFLISLSIMQATGVSLNFLSMFSLLLALGLVVDDAIVIISAITSYYQTNKYTPLEAGILVWRDFIVPIWSTTLTTVWAFAPLILATGIIGQFIRTIPIVVSSTLIASTTVAVIITLPLMVIVLKPSLPKRVKSLIKLITVIACLTLLFILIPNSSFKLPALIIAAILTIFIYKTKTTNFSQSISLPPFALNWFNHGVIDLKRVKHKYQLILNSILNSKQTSRRTIIIVIVLALSSYLLIPLGFVVNEFFPKSDFDKIFLILEQGPGTNNQILNDKARELLPQLASIDQVTAVVAQIGKGSPLAQTSNSESEVLFTLLLTPLKDRQQTSMQIADQLRDRYKDYDQGNIQIAELAGGPPVGNDIEINLSGPELDTLTLLADQLIDHLDNQAGVINSAKSINSGVSKLSFEPDLYELAKKQISLDQLGLQLRLFASDFTYSDITINDTIYDIVYRMNPQAPSPDGISSLSLITPQGTIPITQLGQIILKPNPTSITRQDGQRTLTVTASTTASTNANKANKELQNKADQILLNYPDYSWKTGGANEENANSVKSILQAMFLAGILILITMVVQLNSFRKALVVLMVIPLAASGVFIIFALSRTPLSFPALIGVLALFGIVVNNSIVIVEKINQNLRVGIKLKSAVIDASTNRIEPILFSSLTTITGLIPITLSDPLWRGLGGAIIAGLAFSGAIMLIFIPTVYYAIYKNEVE